MADGNQKKDSSRFEHGEETQTEELIQTLVELNHSVSNINRLLQQLQKNIANNAAHQVDAIAARTLH